MELPKVSVICLCHNQDAFVREAIESVLNQNYANVELIMVDDGSTDESKTIINELAFRYSIPFINLSTSIGNCKAFNQGFQSSTGEYIIDLAADDLMLPGRISNGIRLFNERNIGVEFCNVRNIDQNGKNLEIHFKEHMLVPQGDLYQKLITTYFISPPGMMIKRDVLEELGGYDESLSYEDFDFWIRSSRKYQYGYSNKVLMKKRRVPNSLSTKQFEWKSNHQKSTLSVCKKIKKLNRSKTEHQALKKRCFYEVRNCLRRGNLSLIPDFLRLMV